MDDLTLSKSLAVALGWPEKHIAVIGERVALKMSEKEPGKLFDYRDPEVFKALEARYELELTWDAEKGKWTLSKNSAQGRPVLYSDSPARLIALHAIAATMPGPEFRKFLTKRSADFQEGAKAAFDLIEALAATAPGEGEVRASQVQKWVAEAKQILAN